MNIVSRCLIKGVIRQVDDGGGPLQTELTLRVLDPVEMLPGDDSLRCVHQLQLGTDLHKRSSSWSLQLQLQQEEQRANDLEQRLRRLQGEFERATSSWSREREQLRGSASRTPPMMMTMTMPHVDREQVERARDAMAALWPMRPIEVPRELLAAAPQAAPAPSASAAVEAPKPAVTGEAPETTRWSQLELD